MERFAHALYCDDIRVEVGNKQSLIGIYQSKMFVPSFPIVLPKLCVAIWVVTPIHNPFRKMKLKILSDDSVLFEQENPIGALSNQKPEPPIDDPDKPRVFTTYFAIQLAPFPIQKPTILRVRVATEDEELPAGGLTIEAAPKSTDAPAAPSLPPG